MEHLEITKQIKRESFPFLARFSTSPSPHFLPLRERDTLNNFHRNVHRGNPYVVLLAFCLFAVVSTNAYTQKVVTHPKDQTVVEGDPASFSITATGGTAYSWEVSVPGVKGWVPLTDEKPFSGSKTNELTIESTKITMNGYRFHCVVSSRTSSDTSDDALLTVKEKGEEAKPVQVNWTDLKANGVNGVETTTSLTLDFNIDLRGVLTTDHIEVIGATKGSMNTKTGLSYHLGISNITVNNGQTITVKITSPKGYEIAPESRIVAVSVYQGPMRTVTIGAQVGTVEEGIGGSVTFPVTTANMPNGTYNIGYGWNTAGIFSELLVINNNKGALTINVQPSVSAGTYPLTITTDPHNIKSNEFYLEVSPYINSVCEIGTTKYANLEDALAAVQSGQTIRLLNDIYHWPISISGKSITFNLNGYDLDLHCFAMDGPPPYGLEVTNGGQVNVTGSGALNVYGTDIGVSVTGNSKATVHYVHAHGCGVYASGAGSEVTVNNIFYYTHAVHVEGGAKVTVEEGISAYESSNDYILVGTTDLRRGDYTIPTTKSGYLTYTDKTSTVWVREWESSGLRYVEWVGLTANGTNGSVTTTELTLNFDILEDIHSSLHDITTLTAADITVTGATKGALTGTGMTRKLAISNITVANGQDVTVTVNNPNDYSIGIFVNDSWISPASRSVPVFVAPTVVKSVTVDAQTNSVTTGTAGAVTFPVKTENIANGAYPVTLTGAPAGITATNLTITNNAGTLTLNVAASVDANSYPMTITIDGTKSGNFYLIVNAPEPTPPTFTGPTELKVTKGYETTSVGPYSISGTPTPDITKTSGHEAFTWNNSLRRLVIAAGLSVGVYEVELTASNGYIPPTSATETTKNSDATLIFTLTVTEYTGNFILESNSLKAWTNNGVVYVNGLTPGKPWSLYSVTGVLIYKGIAKSETENYPSLQSRGIYIITHENKTTKVIH